MSRMQRKMRCRPTEGSMNAIGKVTVAVFARVLFDFEEENMVFREDDPAAYCAIQAARLGVPAGPGAAFPLLRKLLAFNTNGADDVEVAILSRNDFGCTRRHGVTGSRSSVRNSRAVRHRIVSWARWAPACSCPRTGSTTTFAIASPRRDM